MINDENGKPENETFEPEVETQEIWRMPKPVFRTSEGTKYARAESEEDFTETREQIPSPEIKPSKMPFLLGGAFLMFFFVTALLAGFWFLYLRNIEPPKILTPEVEKATPFPTPDIESATPIASPTETPTETPTPTPDSGGAPSGSEQKRSF